MTHVDVCFNTRDIHSIPHRPVMGTMESVRCAPALQTTALPSKYANFSFATVENHENRRSSANFRVCTPFTKIHPIRQTQKAPGKGTRSSRQSAGMVMRPNLSRLHTTRSAAS